MKLLLFDIDGTILHAHGQGRSAVESALSRLIGKPVTTEGVAFSGKTDPQILREVLHRNRCDPELADGRFSEVLATYERAALACFDASRVELLRGVAALLAALRTRDDVRLGLLTGNIEAMAYAKLGAVGLAGCFPFGAFGSDDADRYRLPPIALARALRHTGRSYEGKDVVIIGDTPHDIRCGRSLGVFSVAVATGRIGRRELARHKPDLLLDDLSDTGGFIDRAVAR